MNENIQIKLDNNINLENNQSALFQDILDNDELIDVTLVNDEMEFPAHRVILASMSQVFRKILQRQQRNNNTLIYLRGVKSCHIEALISFIYKQEASLPREDLQEFINLAIDLKVNGISHINNQMNDLLQESPDNLLEQEKNDQNTEHITFNHEEVKITKISSEDNQNVSDQTIESENLEESSELPQTQVVSLMKVALPEILQTNNTSFTLQTESLEQEDQSTALALVKEPKANSPQKPQKKKKKLKLRSRGQGIPLEFTVGEPLTSYEEFKEEVKRYLARSEDGDGWTCTSDGCSYFAKSMSNLRSHVEVHIRVKLTCPFCEKVLHRLEYFQRHIYKFHPEKKYDVFPERKPKARPAPPSDVVKTVVKYW